MSAYSPPSPQPTQVAAPMAPPTLQSTLLSGTTGTILAAVGDAEAHVGRRELRFPRIAVFGDESTGKSSVLEAVCRIPFPRGATTTTRCPISVRLVRRLDAPWGASAWLGPGRRHEVHLQRPEDVAEAVARLQQINIDEVSRKGGDAKFSEFPVTVEVKAHDNVDLTLLDLPGYFIHQGRDPTQPESDVIRIKSTLMECISDPRTILLVILRASQVFKTANIFNLLKEYEKGLSAEQLRAIQARTIYCMTMCDLVSGPDAAQEPPQDIKSILDNEGPFAAHPHGWFAVVNNMGRKTDVADFLSRLAVDRQLETQFFDSVAPYNYTHLRPLCGTENLILKLSTILAQEIASFIPSMMSDTEMALGRANAQLEQCGPAPEKDRNVAREFQNIVDDIKNYYRQLGDGNSHGLRNTAPPGVSERIFSQCELGYLRRMRSQSFANAIEMERFKVNEKSYFDYLRIQVDKARDMKLEESLPMKEIAIEEVRRCALKWRALAKSYCNDISSNARRCLHNLVDIRASRYEKLPVILKKFFSDLIEEQETLALKRLEWHYVDEACRPNTENKQYKKLLEASKFSPIGKDVKKTTEAILQNLDAYFQYAEARYADNVIRSVTTHIFDVPLNEELTRVATETKFKYVFQACEIQGQHDLNELMKVRDDLEEERRAVETKIHDLAKLRDALQEQSLHTPVVEEEIDSDDSNTGYGPPSSHAGGSSYDPGYGAASVLTEDSDNGYGADQASELSLSQRLHKLHPGQSQGPQPPQAPLRPPTLQPLQAPQPPQAPQPLQAPRMSQAPPPRERPPPMYPTRPPSPPSHGRLPKLRVFRP